LSTTNFEEKQKIGRGTTPRMPPVATGLNITGMLCQVFALLTGNNSEKLLLLLF